MPGVCHLPAVGDQSLCDNIGNSIKRENLFISWARSVHLIKGEKKTKQRGGKITLKNASNIHTFFLSHPLPPQKNKKAFKALNILFFFS